MILFRLLLMIMKFKEQNLTQAGAVLLLSAIVVKLIGALFKIPLSSDYILGDLGFGYFSAVYDLYIPIYTLALSGFPVAIARMISDFNTKEDFISSRKTFVLSFKVLLIIGVIGTFMFLSLAPLSLLQKGNDMFYSHLLAAPSVLVCCLVSVYRGYFEGLKNMVPTAVSNIIEALCKLFLGLSGALVTMRITDNPALSSAAALAGITVGTVLSFIYLRIKFKDKKINLKEKVYDKALMKSLISLLIPIAIASLSVAINAFIDSVTVIPQLKALIGGSAETGKLLLEGTSYKNVSLSKIPTILYGIKSKAHTLFNLVPTLTTTLGVGAVPLVTQNLVEGDNKNLKKNINLCIKYSAILCMPIAFGFMFVGEGITQLLYGVQSSGIGGGLLSVYGIAALFAGMALPITYILQGLHKQKNALVNILIGIAVKMICNLVLTPISDINIYAAAIGTSACFVIVFVLNMISLIKELGFSPSIKDSILKPFTAAALCGLTACFMYNALKKFSAGIIISIMCAGLVYLVILWVLKVLKKEEISELMRF